MVQESAPPPRTLAIARPSAPATEQAQSHGDDDMETNIEFERQQARRPRRKERETLVQEDAKMTDVMGRQDVIMKDKEKVIINLSDDDKLDHPRECDDDLEDLDAPLKVKEMKPVIARSGVVVKVEKDWWAEDEEKRRKRIACHQEREEKEQERKQKDKELAEANAKLILLELESKGQINAFSSQLEEMKKLINLQASQAWASSSQAPPPPPHVPHFSTREIQQVQHLVSELPYPRVEDKDQATSSANEDVIVSTPTSQVSRAAFPD